MKPIEKEKILRDATYWEEMIKTQLFEIVEQHLKDNKLKKKDFAQQIGVSKGYVSQVLNGDRDHRLSKVVELALAVGKAPFFSLQDLDEVIEYDKSGISVVQQGHGLGAASTLEFAMEKVKKSQVRVRMQYQKPKDGSKAKVIPMKEATSTDFDSDSLDYGLYYEA